MSNTNVFGADVRRTAETAITISGGNAANRFINAGGSAYADVNDTTAGVSMNMTTSAEVVAGTAVALTALEGVALVYAAAQIDKFALVQTNSSGQVVTRVLGLIRGKALAAASASGDIIPILLSPIA